LQDPVSRPQTSNSTRIYSPRASGNPGLPGEYNIAIPSPQSGGHGGGTANHIYRTSSTTESHPLQQSHIPPEQHSPTVSSAYNQQHLQSTQTRPQRDLELSFSSTTVPDISIEPPVSCISVVKYTHRVLRAHSLVTLSHQQFGQNRI
jgi:hypothetical protein